MFNIFIEICELATNLGTVTEAMMYETGFITVDGKTDGKEFKITMSIKEEATDGN